MIDKVILYKTIAIPPEHFDGRMWEPIRVDGSIKGYLRNETNVKIKYYFQSKHLSIRGRFINLSFIKNRVSNLDDVYQGAAGTITHESESNLTPTDMCEQATYDEDDKLVFPDNQQHTYTEEEYYQHHDSIIDSINLRLYQLLQINVDIHTFRVSSIEICFNVSTPNVSKYIELFNLIFIARNSERHVDHTVEQGYHLYTSFYIKTMSQYRDNGKQSYTVNFYNKLDQLHNLDRKIRRTGAYVSSEDLRRAENVLRMEVQCFYNYLSRICERYGIDNRTRPLESFLNIELCRDIVVDKYEYFIGSSKLDFYSYKAAQERILQSMDDNRERLQLLGYMKDTHCYHKLKSAPTHRKYRRLLARLGIHWFFIPTRWGIPFMENPIKLLDNKVAEIKETRYRRQYRGHEWVYEAIENGEIE